MNLCRSPSKLTLQNPVETERNGEVAILRLNRPNSLNAISRDLAKITTQALIELDSDPEVKGIVLTGAGDRAFCAGVDLEEAKLIKVEDIEVWFGLICNVYKQILLTNKPVITALNGVATGGGFQIALVSDFRVAHHGVKLGQPEINAGIPSIMGSYWMSLHLPWSLNQELSMTGRMMDAEEALRFGILNRVVVPEKVIHTGSLNQELSMTGRMMDAEEAQRFGILNRVVAPEKVIETATEVALHLSNKMPTAWLKTKQRFREVALKGFDEAFRSGVLGQQAAFANGEPQAFINAFFAARNKQ